MNKVIEFGFDPIIKKFRFSELSGLSLRSWSLRRSMILDLLRNHYKNGICLKQLADILEIAWTSTLYHIKILEKSNEVISENISEPNHYSRFCRFVRLK